MECGEAESRSDSEAWSSDEDDHRVELVEGATFGSPTEGLHAVQDYALKQGKSVKVESHSGSDRKIVCASSLCNFYVQLYRRSKIVDGKRIFLAWYISSMNLKHSDCVGIAKPTERQIASLTTVAAAAKGASQPPAKTVIEQVGAVHELSLDRVKRKVYRAMARVREETDEQALHSYSLVESYLTAFADKNPGTLAVSERDDASRFRRYLVGRDGNLKNLTIAFGLVPSEDLDSYNWFLDKVAEAGYDLTDIPVFCDRHASIQSAAVSRGLHLRFCTLHIIRNISHNFGKLNKEDKNLIWSIQNSESIDEYRGRLEVLRIARGDKVREYVMSIDPVKWCVFANIKNMALYGWRTSNFIESVFGSQLVSGVRHLHPYAFLKSLCEKIMGDIYMRATNAETWSTKGSKITPGAQAEFDKEAAKIGSYVVMKSSWNESYVTSRLAFPRLLRHVIFSDHYCSCGFMDQRGIPCRHFIAALADSHAEEDAPKYFHNYYTVAAYKAAFGYESIRLPLDQDLKPDLSCLPPLVQKRKGRRKIKRIRSNGEN